MSDLDQAVRDVVKGASIVYVGLFLELLIAFVAQVVAARYLSVGDFGGLTAGTALLDVGSIVAGLGLASGLTRYLPRVEAAQKRLLGLFTVGVTGLTSTILGTGVALNASFIATRIFGDPSVTVSIRIFGMAIPFAALLNVAVGGIRGQERSTDRVLVKNIVQPLARMTLVAAAVWYGLGQAGLAGAYAVPYAVSAIIGLALFYRSLPDVSTVVETNLVSEVTRYSLPFTISDVSSFVYRSSDIFLVLYFLGGAATGIYGVAYAAVSFMGMFSTAFNFLGTPIASRLENEGDIEEVMELFRSVVRWLIVASVCALVPLAVFATDFISIIYQSKYASGGPVLAVLALGFAAKNVLSIHNSILQAVARSKTLSANTVIAAVSNLLLNVLLIPRFGLVGAAIATLLSFLIRDGLAAVQVYLTLGSSPLTPSALRPLVPAVPFLLIVWTVVAPATPGTFLWLLAVTGLTATVYTVVVLVAFGLSETELMIIRSAEEQYGLDFSRIDWLITRLAKR
ncbi:flippase [Haloarcula salinisoli]|uniref:Flippase n=1 Tax=Haloarcula salinisoli TaxID=2487746 RepID=A0A8J7YBL1_9EURY|nr:flippase [Halomicroarcula salinisoli]MBX0303030.1 flippase [Halomicroarcula salinisoli]